jgi:hypothetical protein
MEGAKFIEQKLLEENFKELFSLFTTFRDIDVLQIFYNIQVDFVPTCLQMQNFDSQQGKDMDAHEFQFVLKTTFYTSTFYPIFLLKEYLHLVSLLFILMNCFEFNLLHHNLVYS